MVAIRPARAADIDTLILLLRALFAIEADFAADEEKQRSGLQMLLESKRACLLVAENESGIIGMCTGQMVISTAEGGPALLVEDVVVHESFRGRGVGRMLMEALQKWAAVNNATRLQLLADRNNVPALDFYRRLGWQQTDLICLRTYVS